MGQTWLRVGYGGNSRSTGLPAAQEPDGLVLYHMDDGVQNPAIALAGRVDVHRAEGFELDVNGDELTCTDPPWPIDLDARFQAGRDRQRMRLAIRGNDGAAVGDEANLRHFSGEERDGA